MVIKEVSGNLFMPEKWCDEYDMGNLHFAHCIAADFGMYGGIARQFVQLLDMKEKLIDWAVCEFPMYKLNRDLYYNRLVVQQKKYKPLLDGLVGKSVKIDFTFNLITKPLTSTLPTYQSLESSIDCMKSQMKRDKVTALAIPDMIGCGIDGLDRGRVLGMLTSKFLLYPGTLYIVKFQG